MNAVETLELRERQAREAAKLAREQMAEKGAELQRLALAEMEGEEGSTERARELENELTELGRRAKMADMAVRELQGQARDARDAEEERAASVREREYDGLALERFALLEAVEKAMDDLDGALHALRYHDDAQRGALRSLGYRDDSRPFSEVLEARVAARLADHLPGYRHGRHLSTLRPLTETDGMTATIGEMRGDAEISESRGRERAAERERTRELWELRQRVEYRRGQLLGQMGVDSDTTAGVREQAEKRAEQLLRREFPELARTEPTEEAS